jgi:dTDP-4-amino-4,6-dideoxygalactose transaminase
LDDTVTQEILSAIQQVLASGHYILGNQVLSFEMDFSTFVGPKFGVGVNSGTDALILSLRALGVGPGDEVITVAHTALATVSAIIACGATPVLVDVEDKYFTINPVEIEIAITPRTKAIIPVHIYGQAAEMAVILEIAKKHGLYVLEDCAQATGAEYDGIMVGRMGTLGCFSFYPTKNLGGIGDGGMVVTNEPSIASSVRSLRQYGWDDQRNANSLGLNSRLDELQAAILNVKLKWINRDNQQRIKLAALYDYHLRGQSFKTPKVRKGSKHVYHLYVVQCQDRGSVIKKLNSKDIFPGIHYPKPIHFQSGYKKLCKIPDVGLPVTELLSNKILSLPMYQGLDESKIKFISDCLVN